MCVYIRVYADIPTHVTVVTVVININPASQNNYLYFGTPQSPQWSEHFIYQPRTRTTQMILVQKDACPALASLKEARFLDVGSHHGQLTVTNGPRKRLSGPGRDVRTAWRPAGLCRTPHWRKQFNLTPQKATPQPATLFLDPAKAHMISLLRGLC